MSGDTRQRLRARIRRWLKGEQTPLYLRKVHFTLPSAEGTFPFGREPDYDVAFREALAREGER